MIELQHINRSWPFVLIILLILGLSFILSQFFELNGGLVEGIICPVIVLIFLLKVEKVTFKGRFNNLSFFILLGLVLSSFILLNILLTGVSQFVELISDINILVTITSIRFSILFSFVIYLTFKLIQVLYRRLQDLNLPGKYLIGIVPVISWIIGIKIYQSGKKLLGILVFFNLLLGILYILFVRGTKGYNYFGIQPAQISLYKKEKRRILKAKSISSKEKVALINVLTQKFENIEMIEKGKFITSETNRLLESEKINQVVENDLLQSRKDYFENYVNEIILKNNVKADWN